MTDTPIRNAAGEIVHVLHEGEGYVLQPGEWADTGVEAEAAEAEKVAEEAGENEAGEQEEETPETAETAATSEAGAEPTGDGDPSTTQE